MDMLVTDLNVEVDDKEVVTFDDFITAATGDGLDLQGDLLIDINSVPDEDMYENLKDTGIEIQWITITGDQPSWFNDNILDLSNDEEDESDNSSGLGGSSNEGTSKTALDDDDVMEASAALSMIDEDPVSVANGEKEPGRIITFGSSKGGAGKTFTAIISAVYYAKDHPNERVALLDLDIEEPQVSIAIRTLKPTMKNFYAEYLAGDKSFETMSKYKANNNNMPSNLDFYLTPRDAHVILDNDFWLTCMSNLFMNYDMVVIDTGTSYMTLPPIISAYKVADKLNIVTNAAITSSVTVSNQIKRLTGEIPNDVYDEDDEIANKINLIVTGVYEDNICDMIINKMNNEGNIVAMFGRISPVINRIQILGEWSYYDDNAGFREGIRNIMA